MSNETQPIKPALAFIVPIDTTIMRISYMLRDVPGETSWSGWGPDGEIVVNAGDRLEIHIRRAVKDRTV